MDPRILRMGQVVLVVALAIGCDRPTATGATCPDPDPYTLTWENFGHDFTQRYCIACHDSALPKSKRNKAPVRHDFDTFEYTWRVANHTDEQAGWGPNAHNCFMPPDRCPSIPGGKLDIDCPKPTHQERRNLAIWLACENNREHDFDVDAGVDAPIDAAIDSP
jgi:hypothetical protein